MKITQEFYFCDGCGEKKLTEKEMQLCEKEHKGKILAIFVIGNETIKYFESKQGLNKMFSLKKWISAGNPIYKLPFQIDGETNIFLFEYQGERVPTDLAQKTIPILRLKNIEKDKFWSHNVLDSDVKSYMTTQVLCDNCRREFTCDEAEAESNEILCPNCKSEREFLEKLV